MPYDINEGDDRCPASEPFAVVKQGDGDLMGCHETEDDAEAQLAALNASENHTEGPPMSRVYLRGFVERADDDEDGPVRFVAATEGVKGDGLNLKMDRLDLTRFKANPVILYGHIPFGRDNLPIGRAASTQVDGKKLLTDIEFDRGDEFAVEVERKVRGGFLNAVSVGFEIEDIDQNGVPGRWSLFETSVVPIPMDPHALAQHSRDETVMLARDVRAGKVLSNANRTLIRDARDRLSELLDATADEAGDDGRSVATVTLNTGSVQAVREVLDRGAIKSHSTATTESEWDGPGAVADAPNDEDTLRYMHAWRDPDGDPDEKATYKLPHHAAGTDTAANLPGVRNALSRLPQSNIPESDHSAVESHLNGHLDDADDDDRSGVVGAKRRLTRRRYEL